MKIRNSKNVSFLLLALSFALVFSACSQAPETVSGDEISELPTYEAIDVPLLVGKIWFTKLPGSISLSSGSQQWYMLFNEDGSGVLRDGPEFMNQEPSSDVGGSSFKWNAENGVLSITAVKTSGHIEYCIVGDVGTFRVTALADDELRMRALKDPCVSRSTYLASGSKWAPYTE